MRQFIIVITFLKKTSFSSCWMEGKKSFSLCSSCTFFLQRMKNGNCSLFWWSKQWSKKWFVLMIKLQSILFSIIHNWKRYCCDLSSCVYVALVVFFSSLSSFQELISCLHITDVGPKISLNFFVHRKLILFLLFFKDH